MINKLLLGDCIDLMKQLPENSIDAIVTDPPYELGFMGKEWDKSGIAYDINTWKECLRILKPGAHLLAFGGSRTYHRMACAIEDAGFEIRDQIMWVYGCLSEDTEILTESGYKPLRKLTQYDKIGIYDITNNIYKWERPQRYSVYKVHQDTAYRIKSDYTDQIVSRNHRCLVEREGKFVFITAEELNEVEYMPTLSDDFYSLQENSNRKLLLKELLWKGKGLAQAVFSKWKGKVADWQGISDGKKSSLERWSNLLEETRKLQADKICEVSEGVFTDGEKRWICNGASFDSGSILGDMLRESSSHTSYQSRPTGQPTGKPDVISIKQGTQIIRRARVEKIEYSGIIFCPTVSTGAFVARRNGQVFITGNSGFPKSHSIGKAVDKLQGNEREVVGISSNDRPNSQVKGGRAFDSAFNKGQEHETIHLTKGASAWKGWGTALKPAHEPIVLARKPLSEKTVAENVLKYGTGGINIDGCRVSVSKDDKNHRKPSVNWHNADSPIVTNFGSGGRPIENLKVQGRFPANLILSHHPDCVQEEMKEVNGKEVVENWQCVDECPVKIMDEQSGISKSNKSDYNWEKSKDANIPAGCAGGTIKSGIHFGDKGGASRFFYCAKASRSERNKGCNTEVEREPRGNNQATRICSTCGLTDNGTNDHSKCEGKFEYKQCKPLGNNHPTVKPLSLIKYLIKLITPPDGIVLDPFMGSGTTGIACKILNRNFIGMEKNEEYLEIAKARIYINENKKD